MRFTAALSQAGTYLVEYGEIGLFSRYEGALQL